MRFGLIDTETPGIPVAQRCRPLRESCLTPPLNRVRSSAESGLGAALDFVGVQCGTTPCRRPIFVGVRQARHLR